MKLRKKVLSTVALLFLSAAAHAVTFKTVMLSTNSALVPSTTGYHMVVASGTVRQLQATYVTVSGTSTFNGTPTVQGANPHLDVTATGTGYSYLHPGSLFVGQEGSGGGGNLITGSSASEYVIAGNTTNSIRFGLNNSILASLRTDGFAITASTIGSSGTSPISFDVNGTMRCRLDANAFANYDSVFRVVGANTATFPDYSRIDDTNSGLRLLGSDQLALTTGANDALTIDASGRILRPLQPYFLAIGSGSDQTNVTGDGTEVTVVFGTEVSDIGSSFVTSTWTASVAGKYDFDFQVKLTGLQSTHSTMRAKLTTTARDYFTIVDGTSSVTGLPLGVHIRVPMSANDTAAVHVTVSGGAKVVTVSGAATQSFFSGSLEN